MKKKFLSILFSAFACGIFAQSPALVQFEWGAVRMPDNFPGLKASADLKPDEIVEGRFVRYLHCKRVLNEAERRNLEQTGARILGYVSFGAYLVSLPQNIDYQIFEKFPVDGISTVKPEWKCAASLRERPFGAWAVSGDRLRLNLQYYEPLSPERASALCAASGIQVLRQGIVNQYLEVEIPINAVEQTAALPFVRYLELQSPPAEAEDTRSRNLVRAGALDSDHPLGLHFNGAGIKAVLRDDGIVGPHEDFRGRLHNLLNYNIGNHGDYVAGSMTAAGNIDPSGRGIANGMELFVAGNDYSYQDPLLLQLLEQGAVLTNLSYAEGCNKGYTLSAQTVDIQSNTRKNLTHVFSAGNNGTQNCQYGAGAGWGNITGGHKMAKNSVSVGGLSIDAIVLDASSRGPASDGRLKPEICVQGSSIYMTQPFNQYSSASGTSFAAPGFVGCMAQLTQAFKETHSGLEPESALLKALIFNTATDVGNPGPDFKTGWGLANVMRAWRAMQENRFSANSVDQNGQTEYAVQVPDGVQQARFMICWNDPAASPAAARSLINDLDLTVVGPDGTVFRPLVLNPAPTVAALNAPAVPGRDSLNNAEQVRIDLPAAGLYRIRIAGKEVPLGPQDFYLSWDFQTSAVQLTYPNGGEGLVPGALERIHWDAYGTAGNFILRYSSDDGENWTTITTLNGDRRMYDWQVPAQIGSRTRVMVQRDTASDMSDRPFTIAQIPYSIVVEKVCPDSMTVSWSAVDDTTDYDVFLLGERYMEIVGRSNAAQYSFPVDLGGAPQWISVRCANDFGLAGRRANAVNWPGGLKNCPQQNDLALRSLLAPSATLQIGCGPYEPVLTVQLRNEGQMSSSGALIFYQLENQALVSENLPPINAGASLDFTFSSPLTISGAGNFRGKIWVSMPGEQAFYNDTLAFVLPVVAESAGGSFTQDFENTLSLPNGWTVVNPDNAYTWQLFGGNNMIGPSGAPGHALALDCYDYTGANAIGQQDYLYTFPLDLSQIPAPALVFHVAYAQYDATSAERLRVEALAGCDPNATPQVLWEKFGSNLATHPPLADVFVPSKAQDWRREIVDLKAFSGQKILIRFTGVNDYGNLMYLDDVGLADLGPAQISASANVVCTPDSIVFQAINTDTNLVQLHWNFGPSASPATAEGPGPHTVAFAGAGEQTVTLIGTTPFGTDSVAKQITVKSGPVAAFSADVSAQTVAFTNNSIGATDYLWNFGDGTTGTEANPVHEYAVAGAYSVVLTATNECGSAEAVLPVSTTVGTQQVLETRFSAVVQPNPSKGNFTVKIMRNGPPVFAHMRLNDALGRNLQTREISLNAVETLITFLDIQLGAGVYQLMIDTPEGQLALKVVVENN